MPVVIAPERVADHRDALLDHLADRIEAAHRASEKFPVPLGVLRSELTQAVALLGAIYALPPQR